jgi:dTDP-4-amino-4,6-dideoxygalactose transaminase
VARFPGVDRDRLVKELDRVGVGTKPYYAPALHRQPWDGPVAAAAPLPMSDRLDHEALALPMSSELSAVDAERVFWTVLKVLDGMGGGR